MILVTIDRKSGDALHKQIAKQIESMIKNQALKDGDILPSTRALSVHLEVNRTTVCKAYEELWSLGYIESRPGSYSRIRNRPDITNSKNINETGINWYEKLSPSYKRMSEKMASGGIQSPQNCKIDFTTLSSDPAYWPVEEFRKSINRILQSDPETAMSYEDPRGNMEFRKELSKYLGRHQIYISEKNILVTNGSQDAIDLVLKALLHPGDTVICSEPTYCYLPSLVACNGGTTAPIPLTDSGMDIHALEEILENNNCSLLYTMPCFQNPSGLSISQKNREKLLELCSRYNVPILEDGFLEELKYHGETILPIKSMDSSGIVIYVGTFSKILFPGLRTGWIAASPKLIDRLAEIRRVTRLSGNPLIQMALTDFLKQDKFEYFLKKIHTRYRERINAAMKAARRHLSLDYVRYTKPSGGYTFLVYWDNPPISEKQFLSELLRKGVAVSPGSLYFQNPSRNICVRISLSKILPEEIEQGIKIISETIRENCI